MPVYVPAVPVRKQAELTARGIINESYAIPSAGAGVIPTTGSANGSLVGSLVGFSAGDVITNLICYVTVAGASLTLAKLGLFTKAGVFLRATASAHATFNSGTGYRVIALTSAYTITSTDGYYIAYLGFGSGATGPTIMRGSGTLGVNAAVGSGARSSMAVLTQTDISADVTPGTAEAAFWFAAS